MNTGLDRLSITRIKQAVNRIDPVFLNSRQYTSESLSNVLQSKIILKVEIENPIRSFKGRGTELLIYNLRDENEIVCASAGNFGQAMAFSCGKTGAKLTVFASVNTNRLKIERMRALGANVILQGNDFDEAKTAAKRFAEKFGKRFVEDSLDIETVEGAGTIGLELLNLTDKLDYMLIALGNGALLTGIAKVFKVYSPETKIVAVQAKGAPAMIKSWQSGMLITNEKVSTIADGIAVRLPVPQVLNDMKGLVDEGLLVKDDSIIESIKLLHQYSALIVEPSGAVGIAAILENQKKFRNKIVGTIICGGNMTEEQMKEWL